MCYACRVEVRLGLFPNLSIAELESSTQNTMSGERELKLSQAKLDLIYEDAQAPSREKDRIVRKEISAEIESCLKNARAAAEDGQTCEFYIQSLSFLLKFKITFGHSV